MVRRRLSVWSFFIMPLFFLLFYGCDLTETMTSSPPVPTNTSDTPDISTTSKAVNKLSFEELFIPLSMKEEDIPHQIHVVTDNNTSLPSVIDHISEEGMLALDGVDFSKYFVIFVFMGRQPLAGPVAEVTQILQADNIVYVQANFPQMGPTVQPGFSYPKKIIKVSKDIMNNFSEITFILLDQDENQRAITNFKVFK